LKRALTRDDNRRTSEMRTLTCIVALSVAMLMNPSAFAATTAAKACAADVKKQCGDEMKSGGAVLNECMKTHFSDLSADCQVAIVRTAAVRKACKADEKKLCADVKPRAMGACMKSHAADLSSDCKEALAKTSGK
jgi:hypothetical protein